MCDLIAQHGESEEKAQDLGVQAGLTTPAQSRGLAAGVPAQIWRINS